MSIAGRSPVPRQRTLGGDDAAVRSIHCCMAVDQMSRTPALSSRATPASASLYGRQNGSKKARCVPPELVAVSRADWRRRPPRRVDRCEDPLQKRHQHRVFGREVEVEGRTGDPRPLARSSTEISAAPLLQQPIQRCLKWPAHGRRPTAGRRVVLGRHEAGQRLSRHKLYSMSIFSTEC